MHTSNNIIFTRHFFLLYINSIDLVIYDACLLFYTFLTFIITNMEEAREKQQNFTDKTDSHSLDIQHVESNNLDADAQRLQDLGYKQEFKREISLFVQTGFR